MKDFSKEELINIIADLSIGFVVARMSVDSAMAMMSSNPSSCEVGTSLSDAINTVASKLMDYDFSNQQTACVNECLFKRQEK